MTYNVFAGTLNLTQSINQAQQSAEKPRRSHTVLVKQMSIKTFYDDFNKDQL